MVVVGTNGNTIRDDTQDALLEATELREFTAYDRDPFQREFGIGIKQAIGNPGITPTDLAARLRASFELSDWRVADVIVTRRGTGYHVELSLEGTA